MKANERPAWQQLQKAAQAQFAAGSATTAQAGGALS